MLSKDEQSVEESSTVETPLFGVNLDRWIHPTLFYLIRLGAAWMIAEGLWYFAIERYSSGTTLFFGSPLIDTGRNFVFIGIFVILFITGDLDGRK